MTYVFVCMFVSFMFGGAISSLMLMYLRFQDLQAFNHLWFRICFTVAALLVYIPLMYVLAYSIDSFFGFGILHGQPAGLPASSDIVPRPQLEAIDN